MAFLLFEDQGKESLYELHEGATTIGRHPDNTIQLTAGTVSGRHARIQCKGDSFILADVGSRNGTTVNGNPLAGPVRLVHKDKISFGDAHASFLTGPEPQLPGEDFEHLTKDGSAPELAAGSATLSVEIADSDSESIASSIDTSSRFGALDSKPKDKLKAVLEISTSLAGNVNLEKLLPKILDTLFNIFKYADRGCILVKDDKSGKLVPRITKHRQAGRDESVRLSRTILDLVMKEKKGIRSKDAAFDELFSGSESIADMRIRSMMCVPMLSLDGAPIGAISIDSLNPLGQFTDEDLDILLTVAGQAALSYETARLIAIHAQKQKQDNEMLIAQEVQRALLPDHLPEVPGYEFFASYDAAQAIGGDYYDVIELADGRICISFGDVAGKGVPGALVMSRMHSCVQSTLAHVSDVESAMKAINTHMCDSAIEGRFVTYVLIILDPKTHELTLSNAGHMSPLIRHADGRIESFNDDIVGPPIGVVEDFPYEVETKTLNPGEMVLIVTDGVDDAMNPAGEFYGQQRIFAMLSREHTSAKELGESLLADVRRHASGREQNDDITIFAFGRTRNA